MTNDKNGLSAEGATRAARRAFGNRPPLEERSREVWQWPRLESIWGDVRVTWRGLRKSPGFTITAVLTLTLAIGANAVVFGLLNALILRPLNVPQAESLFIIQPAETRSYPDYLDLRQRNRSFDDVAVFAIRQSGLDTGKDPSNVWQYETSGNYFDVLRIQPYIGRFFHSSDEHGPNSAPYVVLSYAYWHSHFQDDRTVVGRVVRLNRHPLTILGVAPPAFQGTILFFAPDIFLPIVNHEQLTGEKLLNGRGIHWMFEMVGHLKPGVTPAQATGDLNSVDSYLKKNYPKEEDHASYTLARPGLHGDYLGGGTRTFLAGLMLLSGLILLAACANLGSLFAARAADRFREVVLRLALGSSRSRILRQLFTESVLLSLAGGVAGLVASILLLRRLSVWRPVPQFPLHVPVNPDANVYLVALVLALVSGVLFGIVPVRQILRANPYEIVKAGSTGAFGRRTTVRDVLLVVQIAICAVLVTSSMVAVRGLMRSLHSNFGFEPRNAMLVDIDLTTAGYSGERVPAMQRRMIDALQAIPGADSVGSVNWPPLELPNGGWQGMVYTDTTTDLSPSNAAADPHLYNVTPDYFRASGTSLLAGRAFTWHDDTKAQRVAVVNREFASKILGSVPDAVGRYFKMRDGTRVRVVGLVEDGKYKNLTEDQQPAMFLPLLQSPASWTWLVVRSSRDPQELAVAMRSVLRDIDPGMVLEIRPWTTELGGILFPSRMATISLGVLGLMGAMLSITGIFGMAAYSVSKRLRELGIRMALGAKKKAVLQAALGRPLKLLAIGSGVGLVLGLLATKVLAFIVYQATPRDPLVLAGVVLSMMLLGLVATWIPAQRALSVNPLILLRED